MLIGGQVRASWDTVPGYFCRLETSGDLVTWVQPAPSQAPLTRREEFAALPPGAGSYFFRLKFSPTSFPEGP